MLYCSLKRKFNETGSKRTPKPTSLLIEQKIERNIFQLNTLARFAANWIENWTQKFKEDTLASFAAHWSKSN